MIYRRLILPLLFILLVLSYSRPTLVSRWERNSAALITMRSLQSGNLTALHNAERTLISLASGTCQGDWLLGIVYNSLSDLERRDQAWEAALRCSPVYIQLVQAMAPGDIHFAELAVQAYPEQAGAWFWLADLELKDTPAQAIHTYWQGLQRQPHNSDAWLQLGRAFTSLDIQDALSIYNQQGFDRLVLNDPLLQDEPQFILASILAKSQPERAILLYRQGLQHKPNDGVRWYELGDLLSKIDPSTAIEAYLQSCHYGDPGKHGCYGAGLVAEQQGNLRLAIKYYRLSNWEVALQKADQLEQSLP